MLLRRPGDHRSDESSTGYSFVGCSPAEPMSASPILRSFSLNPAAVQSSAANRKLSPFSLSQHRGPLQGLKGQGVEGTDGAITTQMASGTAAIGSYSPNAVNRDLQIASVLAIRY
jgi:hypothetical protein